MDRRTIGLFAATFLAAAGSFWAILPNSPALVSAPRLVLQPKTEADRFVHAAIGQIGVTTRYSPGYVKIPYPNGDVPLQKGVCTDVVIRALREVGTDLQKAIHEDAKKFPSRYPRISKLDSNIDHRRCPNMSAYFQKYANAIDIELKDPSEWKSGDIVFWKLFGGKDHVGVLSTKRNLNGFPFVIHNIGAGVAEEDVLGNWTIIGRFRLPLRIQK